MALINHNGLCNQIILNNKGDVSQTTSFTTTVVSNYPSGKITTYSLGGLLSNTRDKFTVSCSYCNSNSLIFITIQDHLTMNKGIEVNVCNITDGSFDIGLFAHHANANSAIIIGYEIK